MASHDWQPDKKPVWLDCDPGHDDAVALLLAVHLPNVHLLGVSTSASNAPVAQTTLNAARFLYASGLTASSSSRSSPLVVHPGCARPFLRPARHDPDIHGSDGLGGVVGLPDSADPAVQAFVPSTTDPGDAVQGIRKAVEECRSKGVDLTLVVTGSSSLSALFILSFPSLIGPGNGIGEIVFMGGAAGVYGNRSPTAEFNVLLDPEAAQVVVDAECKVVMIGLNVTHTAIWHSDLHNHLLSPTWTPGSPAPSTPSTPLRRTLASLFAFFASSYSSVFSFTRGPPIHDALCLLYVSRPDLFKGKRYRVEVEREGRWCKGTTVVDVYGDRDQEFTDESKWGREGKNVWVAESFDVSEGWRVLLKAVHEADKVSPLNKGVNVPEWIEPSDAIVHL